MDTETTEYPIATGHLVKGSVIAAQAIEKAFNVKRGTDAYQLAAMRAVEYIAERFEERGEIVTITQRKHDLVVLTDDEAIEHNARQFKAGIRKSTRSHHRALGVDRSRVAPERLADHDRGLEAQGRTLAAIRQARREVKPAPRERSTPALTDGRNSRKRG